MTEKPPVADLIVALAERIGVPAFVAVCTDLLGGADREDYVEELRSLTGHDWEPGDGVLDRDSWHDYWVRTWGASGTAARLGRQRHVGGARGVWPTSTGGLPRCASRWPPGTRSPAPVTLPRCCCLTSCPGSGPKRSARSPSWATPSISSSVRDRVEDPDEAVRSLAERALAAMTTRLDISPDA